MTHPTDSQAAPPGRPDSPLAPYRVLDLTEGGVNWAGRLLSDMGADVIRVEPPGGSPTRNRGPFYQDEPHPERSLYWTAYNLNKRGVTLDLERPEGQDLFTRLAAMSDFILESSTPGTMRDLGLGYEQMSALNPGIIYTSITPFGQSGPYARYKTTDMALWAMGGALYVCGDGDRPPARVSVPQAEHQGGAQGAAGSLIALFARHATGEGQHVDISIQAAVVRVLMNAASNSVLMGVNIERGGGTKKFEDLTVRDVFPTLDGYIAGTVSGGNVAWRSTEALIRWMDAEGKASDFLKSQDWRTLDYYKIMTVGGPLARDFERCQAEFAAFFASKTKAEIYAHAVSDKMLLAPVNNMKDLLENEHLAFREFWQEVDQPGMDASFAVPGPYIKMSETPIEYSRAAPLIGEHNAEVFGEIGVTDGDLERLREAGVV